MATRIRVLAVCAALVLTAVGVPDVAEAVPATTEAVPFARPSAPLTPTAVSRFEAVTLTWRAPNSSGGEPISGYRVQRRTPSGWTTVATTRARPRSYTVTGLTNLRSYTFRIAAINADGIGPSSATVTGTPRPYALAPRSMEAAPADRSAVLSWLAPRANDTSRITGYRIQRRTTGGSFTTVRTVPGSARSATVTGLQNGTTYTFRVNAVNSVGNGAFSAEAAVSLPVTRSVVAGGNHTCAVMPDTTVTCWGADEFGQLGDGTVGGDRGFGETVLGPDGVSQLTGVVRIDLSSTATCAVLSDRTVACWGDNSFNQLGDIVAGDEGFLSAVPHAVIVEESLGEEGSAVLQDAVEVAVGERHACARLVDRTVRCWGGGADGQIGNGTTPPVALYARTVLTSSGDTTVPLDDVIEIDAGSFSTCARIIGGTVRCWGNGENGRLGTGGIGNESVAVPVITITSATDLTVGEEHACAVVSGGLGVCWGSGVLGQIGDGLGTLNNSTPQVVRVEVAGDELTGIESIAAGMNMTCAQMTDGTARCWGYNPDGQLGDGTTTSSSLPVTVVASGATPLRNVGSLSSGGDHTCVRRDLGRLLCWGYNANGQVGNGSTDDAPVPVVVTAIG